MNSTQLNYSPEDKHAGMSAIIEVTGMVTGVVHI